MRTAAARGLIAFEGRTQNCPTQLSQVPARLLLGWAPRSNEEAIGATAEPGAPRAFEGPLQKGRVESLSAQGNGHRVQVPSKNKEFKSTARGR